jgi:hypothetical protein
MTIVLCKVLWDVSIVFSFNPYDFSISNSGLCSHIYIYIYGIQCLSNLFNEYRVCHPSKLARFTCESCQQLVANLAQELQHPEASS